MSRSGIFILILITVSSVVKAQSDEIWLENNVSNTDTMSQSFHLLTPAEVTHIYDSVSAKLGHPVIMGYINSIYHEPVDSVQVIVSVGGVLKDSLLAYDGLFISELNPKDKNVELTFKHPDYHATDTSFQFNTEEPGALLIDLEPLYKILLRGRVFAGNLPLENVAVIVLHNEQKYKLKTRGCFYDDEDYWNCLFHGMFKIELTAEDPSDSITLSIYKEGLKPITMGMKFNEYNGEIMQVKMAYESFLPYIPQNNVNFKLGFPLLSMHEDWFVDLNYYRFLNTSSLRRLAYGVEANIYLTNITVSHETFPGMDLAESDSTYINSFIGPSAMYWLTQPERRNFSSYVGGTISLDLKSSELVPQIFIGTRFFLDLNKAISFDVRYCNYDIDVMHYIFNPYGNAAKYGETDNFSKIHATLGIQIVF